MSVREFDLIDRYFSGLTKTEKSVICGIGDDAAVMNISSDQELLVSVDTLVSDIHFLSSTEAYDIGYKSLAVSLSDIAAMGGVPRWATLALTLPKIDADWIQTFAEGFAQIANEHSVTLVGGDTTKGPLSITVQIMGTVARGSSIKRSGARVDDLIYVSGCLGAAALANENLLAKKVDKSVPKYCIDRLHRPMPRVDLGQILNGLASAAIDISDGFAADLNHILVASGVAARVDLNSLPVCEDVAVLKDEDQKWQLALAGGDDYELCFTLPAQHKPVLEKRLEKINYPISCVGTIAAGDKLHWMQKGGAEVNLDLTGFQHFPTKD